MSVFGCGEAGSTNTKAQVESTTPRTTTSPPVTSVTPPSNASATMTTTAIPSSSTTKRCEEMQAIDEPTSRNIVVRPIDVPQEQKTAFQPTSTRGVTFPETPNVPTLVVTFGTPAEVQSITIPRDKTPGANTQQFSVVFFAPNGSQINRIPISSTISPINDPSTPAKIDATRIPFTAQVSRLEIQIYSTTDGRSPIAVILDIKACVEPTTG